MEMKNLIYPLLDTRTPGQILEDIQRLASGYTPEWQMDMSTSDDAGVAVAKVFSDMFYETLDRFNRVPFRNYIAFLNALDINPSPFTSARGIVRFEVDSADDNGVVIKKGTQLGAKDVDLIFETLTTMTATPANLVSIVCVDPIKDTIEIQEPEKEVILFNASQKNNIQRHEFYISEKAMLNVKSEVSFHVIVQTNIRVYDEEVIKRLVNLEFAEWSWFDGTKHRPFVRVFEREGGIVLEKDEGLFCAQGENPRAIRCSMTMDAGREIIAQQIKVRTIPKSSIKPDFISAGDAELSPQIGGFCFGRMPVSYDCLYFSSEETLSKEGATVILNMDIKTIIVEQMNTEQQYEFKKLIVEKGDKILKPADIYISDIHWEYWNGIGWARLNVSGDINPFSCEESTIKQVRFVCPGDFSRVELNAHDGFFIRARIAFVENSLSNMADRRVPYLESVEMEYSYADGDCRRIDRVCSNNNCNKIQRFESMDNLNIPLYERMESEFPTMYFNFDRPVMGSPVNIYFEQECQHHRRSIEIEAICERGMRKLKYDDGTNGFSDSGMIRLVIQEPLKQLCVCGIQGYWIKIVDKSKTARNQELQRTKRIAVNAMWIVQREKASPMLFDAGVRETNKRIQLVYTPVLDCEVWMDESHIPEAEQYELLKTRPEMVQANDNKFWVKWERVETFKDSLADSRHYTLDEARGEIMFGDGCFGSTPSSGTDAIMVKYAFGGGKAGNLPTGGVTHLIGSISNVSGVKSFVPTCGGNEPVSIDRLCRLGNGRIRHRFRASTVLDYESMIMERFSQVADVRCFSNTDENERYKNGYITVVINPEGENTCEYEAYLCTQIREYLSERIDCLVLAADRLRIISAPSLVINAHVSVEVKSFEALSDVEPDIQKAAESLFLKYKGRIGLCPRLGEFYTVVKWVQNVSAVRGVILEGEYHNRGKIKYLALDGKQMYPFAVVKSGKYTVTI